MEQQYKPYRPDDITAVYTSDYGSKKFASEITQRQIVEMPARLSTEPHPPLSIRQAIALAQAHLHGMVEEPERWRLGEVTLKPFGSDDRWFYIIQFSGFFPPNVIDGSVPRIRVVVLMSGEVIESTVTEHPLGEASSHERGIMGVRPHEGSGHG